MIEGGVGVGLKVLVGESEGSCLIVGASVAIGVDGVGVGTGVGTGGLGASVGAAVVGSVVGFGIGGTEGCREGGNVGKGGNGGKLNGGGSFGSIGDLVAGTTVVGDSVVG